MQTRRRVLRVNRTRRFGPRRQCLTYRPLTDLENRVDRYGKPLEIYDHVHFLTPGRVQRTNEGMIQSFVTRYVKIIDDRGVIVQKEPQSLRKELLRVDKYKTPLRVGDPVQFLTPGVQTTDKGRIESFSMRYINCIDENGVHVRKKPHNVILELILSSDSD